MRNNRQATDEVENIITNLEKHNYASIVVRSTVNNGNREGAAVTAEDADAISVSFMDFEAQAWIASGAGDR